MLRPGVLRVYVFCVLVFVQAIYYGAFKHDISTFYTINSVQIKFANPDYLQT